MEKKAVLDLLKVLGTSHIHDRGDWVSASCPFAPWFHENKMDMHPSFGINHAKEFFKCYACDRKGSIMKIPTILSHLTGRDLPELRKILAEGGGIFNLEITPAEKPKELIPLDEKILNTFSNKLSQVGAITPATIRKWGLLYDMAEARLIFPIRDMKGRLVGIRGRFLGASDYVLRWRTYAELHPSGDPKTFGIWYGMHFPLVPDKPLVLVEGERDTVLASQAGAHNVWGTMGAALSDKQIDVLKEVKNPILMFFDNDKAGRQTAAKVYRNVKGYTPISHVTDYCGCKDPAELIEKKLIQRALASVRLIRRME